LLAVFLATLATLLVPVPFSLQATDYGNILLGSHKAQPVTWGGVSLWSSCISHIFTMSHWSSGPTVCFPPQGAAVCTPGVQPLLWNWDCLLALSRYSRTYTSCKKSFGESNRYRVTNSWLYRQNN
jgi:hypothetical protein